MTSPTSTPIPTPFSKATTTTPLRLLARGNASSIYVYGPSPSNSVILKSVLASSPRQQSHLKNEYLFLKELLHANLVRPLRYQEGVALGTPKDKQSQSPESNNGTDRSRSDTGRSNILVLEFAEEGSLLHLLKKRQTGNGLTPPEKRELFRQVSEGVHYLHSHGIAHRDLKLENILIFRQEQELVAKVSDLGLASRFKIGGEQQRIKFKECKGTRKGYMAPEIHACYRANLNQDQIEPYEADSADVFALGVVLFAMVMGTLPFQLAQEGDKLYRMVKEGKKEEFWTTHSGGAKIEQQQGIRWEEFKGLFWRMVAFDPMERPTMKEVLASAWVV